MDKNFSCMMLCEVKMTDEIKNDHLFKQNPMLVSKCLITNKNLSEYQLNQIKKKVLINTILLIFERFIQLGKHVKIAINISITGAFG